MKTLLKYYILIFLIGFAYGCDEPAPIELVNEVEQDFEVELLSTSSNSTVFAGYDSTGITTELPANVSIVSISGIKNSIEGLTVGKGSAQAVFFDTTKPVYIGQERLISYSSIEPGKVMFGNLTARIVPYKLTYRDNFTLKDTLIGSKYFIDYRKHINPQSGEFPYNSLLNFRVDIIDKQPYETEITIPPEIFGNVRIIGNKDRDNLELEIIWERMHEFNEEIIIGGILNTRDVILPLIKLRPNREGRIKVPNSFIKEIPFDKFRFIVFSFIRNVRSTNFTNNLGNIYFASQSIHNIWVKIP